MFNNHAYVNSRPDGFGVMEIAEKEAAAETPRLFVPLKRTNLTGRIAGPLADMTLTQTFGYSSALCDKTLEAVYRFPLPGDAAVTGVTVRFGETEIEARLKEREQAEEDYAQAKQEGRQASLLTRETPDVFTLQVAGIQPDQEIAVQTRYVQLARSEGPNWTLRIPLTTAPRYVRSDESGLRQAQGQPLALLRDPGHRFTLDLSLPGAGSVASPTHALAVTEEEDALRVRLQEGEVTPDRDCALTWQAKQETQRPNLHVLLHDDPTTQHIYFLAQIAPPKQPEAEARASREVVLLVDHSGSMEGAKWEAADWAVQRFLSDLSAQDTFALGLFHNTTRWFAPKTLPADAQTVQAAIDFLKANRDSGGTELGVALEQALDLGRSPGEKARNILIVTDAQVTDQGRLMRLASAESTRTDRRRINLLCIDAAPNSLLANQLAEEGAGVAKFLTSAPDEEDITTALDSVLEDWSAPLYAGLRLEINRPDAQAVGRKTLKSEREGGSVVDLGDLPAGRAAWIAGRVPRGASPDLSFRALTADNRVLASCRRDLAAPNATCPAIRALFGAKRVLDLEFLASSGLTGAELIARLEALGYDSQTIAKSHSRKVYAENAFAAESKPMRALIAQEALEYGLASSETAFVATRTEAGKPVEGVVAVANALPAGWNETFAMAQYGASRSAAAPRMARFMASASAAPAAFNPQVRKRLSQSNLSEANMSYDVMSDAAPAPAQPTPSLPQRIAGLFTHAAAPSAPPQTATQSSPGVLVFSGVPAWTNGEAVLFDSSRATDAQRLPEGNLLTKLEVRFPNGTPDAAQIDSGLTLLLYVDDLAAPRARARLADLARQGGARPLNIQRAPGQVVRLVLADANGVWARNAPALEVYVI